LKDSTILIVEDNNEIRMTILQWLRTVYPTCTFLEARSGEEALQKVIDFFPDVILMDVGLPQMDGFEATRQILAISPDVKIVILTIHDENAYCIKAKQAGAAAFLPKQRVDLLLLPLLGNLLAESTQPWKFQERWLRYL
jgi:two-component system, NarL family, invasion response regulator UvrY